MENKKKGMFDRVERLLGNGFMDAVATKRVIIFGVGGVGSWCAESLVRSGVSCLTIVDNDTVALSNCNRQLMATAGTIGEAKVEALRRRLLDINPCAQITAIRMVYDQDSADSFGVETYDYVIDAIDSLREKIQLIMHVTGIGADDNSSHHPVLFSSMGAAQRIDPTKVTVAEFWKVRNDTLAAALRKRLRQRGLKPARKFMCVYSDELPMPNLGELCSDDAAVHDGDSPARGDWNARKAQINGSLAHITGIFGLTLSGLVLSHIAKTAGNKCADAVKCEANT